LTNHPRVHAAAADDDDGYAMGEEAGMVFFSIQGKLPIGMYAVCFAMQSTIHIVHMIVACLTYPLTLVGTQANLHVEQTSMVTRVHMEGFYRQISHSEIYSRWSLTRRGKKHGAMAVSSKILRPYLPAPTDDHHIKSKREMLEVDVNKMNDWITCYMHATCFIILFQRFTKTGPSTKGIMASSYYAAVLALLLEMEGRASHQRRRGCVGGRRSIFTCFWEDAILI
jgi:hypothetical protein